MYIAGIPPLSYMSCVCGVKRHRSLLAARKCAKRYSGARLMEVQTNEARQVTGAWEVKP